MTTKISNIYDQLNTLIGTALSSYTQIPNPYEPTENPSLYLKKGFGIGFGSGANSFRSICDKETLRRDLNVILINQVFASQASASNRASYEKSLLEDQWTVINALAGNDTLTNYAVKAQFISDSGIQYAESGTEKYIAIEMVLEIEYFEQTTL